MSGSSHEESAATGRTGEDVAARYLERHGCRILARNWRAHPGEIDIIALCPISGGLPARSGEPGILLAFVEVRTRHGRVGLAEESISRRKALSMAAAAYDYMSTHDLDPEATPWRIDLIAIAMSGSDIKSINWVQGAIDQEMLEGTWL